MYIEKLTKIHITLLKGSDDAANTVADPCAPPGWKSNWYHIYLFLQPYGNYTIFLSPHNLQFTILQFY